MLECRLVTGNCEFEKIIGLNKMNNNKKFLENNFNSFPHRSRPRFHRRRSLPVSGLQGESGV